VQKEILEGAKLEARAYQKIWFCVDSTSPQIPISPTINHSNPDIRGEDGWNKRYKPRLPSKSGQVVYCLNQREILIN
jgi:hypothetical protein